MTPTSLGKPPTAYTLERVVTRQVVTISLRATVAAAEQLLRERSISGLGVLNERGQLTGVVSRTELARARSAKASVSSVMVPRVFAVDLNLPVTVAARMMTSSRLHRLFVKEHDKVIGVVSLTDIVRLVGEVGLPGDSADAPTEKPLSQVIDVEKPREVFIESLSRCGEELTGVFYQKFLASSDEIRRRFASTDMKRQRQKLASTLALAASVVSGEPEALARLRKQAALHDRHHLNVRPELYDCWLEALLAAVAHCDPEFAPPVEHSWRLLMGHVIHQMTRHY